MKFTPKNNRCLILPEAAPKQTAGGLWIPDTVENKRRSYRVGKLISLGPGAPTVNGSWNGLWPTYDGKTELNGQTVLPNLVGKRVLYFTWDYQPHDIIIDDLKYHVIRDLSIDGYFTDDGLTLVPVADRIIIQRTSAAAKKGLIHVPDTAQKAPNEGVVVATGGGRLRAHTAVDPLLVSPGDYVLYTEHKGVDLDDIQGFEGHRVIVEDDVMAILEGRDFAAIADSDKPASLPAAEATT